jgi:hypothetical protein
VNRHECLVDPWRDRLATLGVNSLQWTLEPSTGADRPAGRWQALTKPGLGGRERWRWELSNGAGESVLYLKRYAATPLRDQWDRVRRQCATHSRGWWEFDQSRRLSAARIPVARAVGFAEQMRGALERRSAVLLERVPGNAFDRVWTQACAHGDPLTRGAARRDVARRLARLIAAFHGTGACHRDLYLCHVFIELDPEARRPPAFYLIDLARTHRPRWRKMRWILKDLAQLDSSARAIGAPISDWRPARPACAGMPAASSPVATASSAASPANPATHETRHRSRAPGHATRRRGNLHAGISPASRAHGPERHCRVRLRLRNARSRPRPNASDRPADRESNRQPRHAHDSIRAWR